MTSHLRVVISLALTLLVGCIDEEPETAPDPVADAAPRPARDQRVDPPDVLVADAAIVDAEVDVAVDAGPAVPACANAEDDDGDGVVDLADPGCVDGADDDEADPDPLPVCGNGLDDDEDGLIDYPADPDCAAAGGPSEGAVCGPGRALVELVPGVPTAVLLPNAEPVADATCGEGIGAAGVARIEVQGPSRLTVTADPPGSVRLFARDRCRDRVSEVACRAADDESPLVVPVEGTRTLYIFAQPADGPLPREVDLIATVEAVADTCRNGLDDDGDGLADQADPGCADRDDPDETDPVPLPACGNGLDDDGDGAVDWPDDDDCAAAGGLTEGVACGTERVVELGEGRHQLGFEFDSAVEGATRGQCGGNGSEAVALLRIARPSRLVATITTDEIGTFATYLRQICDDPTTETLCDAAFTHRTLRVDRLERGTYALFFDHDVGFEERVDALEADVRIEPLEPRACENGVDDDADGAVDGADPGCARPGDDDEADPAAPPPCADGVDNEGDGFIDWPEDGSCPMAGSAGEGASCAGDGPFIPVGDAGGSFSIDARPFEPGRAIARCGGDLGAESIFVLDLSTAADLRVNVREAAGPWRAFIRTECEDAATELGCADEGPLELDAVPPGRAYLFVEVGGEGRPIVDIEVDSLIRACNDGDDNDGDGLVDLADPGCRAGLDRSEVDPPEVPACFDGVDNDGDGATDWPDDPECVAAGDPEEALVCNPPLEVVEMDAEGGRVRVEGGGEPVEEICGGVPGVGREAAIAVTVGDRSRITATGQFVTIAARTDCASADTELACGNDRLSVDVDPGTVYLLAATRFGEAEVEVSVSSLVRKCNDEIDNDGDGLIDLADPGCTQGLDDDEGDPPELPECADGVDNDEDGAIDWPDDPECQAAGTPDEDVACLAVPDFVRVPPEGGAFETDTNNRENLFEAGCAGRALGGENVLVLVLDGAAEVDIHVVDGDYDTALFIRTSCDDDGREVACDDDGGEGTLSRIRQRLDAGTWFIFVDGFARNSGQATVRVDIAQEE